MCEPTPAHRRLSIYDSSAYWSLPLSFLSPPHIGQSRHVCSWLIYCRELFVAVVWWIHIACCVSLIDLAACSRGLRWSLSTCSYCHPYVEVVCYWHRGQCYMRRLGKASFAHTFLTPMHWRHNVLPFPQGYTPVLQTLTERPLPGAR